MLLQIRQNSTRCFFLLYMPRSVGSWRISGGKVVAEGGTNLRQRARHIMQPDPPAVQCSVRGGHRQVAAGPYAGPTPRRRYRRRRDPHSFRATLTKVKMKMSTRAAYTARKILKIHRQKMPLCCCRCTVIYLVRYRPRNMKILFCILFELKSIFIYLITIFTGGYRWIQIIILFHIRAVL